MAKAKKRTDIKSAQSISPKETTYRGITFHSRLEARWAIYLDHNPLVNDWAFEAQTIRDRKSGWTYTPDFIVKAGVVLQGALEIKPVCPTQDYIDQLVHWAPRIPGTQGMTLALCFGDFFKGEPLVFKLGPEGANREEILQKAVPLSKVPILGHQEALEKAGSYRFDLPDQLPKFRNRRSKDWRKGGGK